MVLRGIAGLLASVVVLAAFAAGCGGSDEPSLTRGEFVKQGDAICLHASEEKGKALEVAFRERGKSINTDKVKEELVTEVALPPYIKMTEELKDLGSPEGAEEQFDEFIAGLEEGTEELEANPSLALAENDETYKKADKVAQEIGMKECSLV